MGIFSTSQIYELLKEIKPHINENFIEGEDGYAAGAQKTSRAGWRMSSNTAKTTERGISIPRTREPRHRATTPTLR